MRRRNAFTLVELVASMAIMVILMLAMASVITFSTRTTSGQGVTNQVNLLTAADSVDQISDDLNVALNFSECTATSVAFTVPDRVSNGTPNQIRYAWSGTSGAALTRQFCPSATPTLAASSASYPPVTLLSNVTNFDVNYLLRQMGPAPAAADSVLFSTPSVALSSVNDYSIDSQHWLSEYVVPTVSLGTVSYTITRVQIQLKTSAAQDGILFVRVTNPDVNHKPLGAVLEQEPAYEAGMSSSYEYYEVDFKSLTGLNPLTGVCVVVGYTSGTAPIASAQYESALLNILSTGGWSTTSNAGSTWTSPTNLDCLQCYVYGTTP